MSAEVQRSKPSDSSSLLFRWKKPKLWDWRVPFCVMVAVFGHAFAFYVFKVVYPPSDRIVPRSNPVSILHEDNPDARKLLSQLEDRGFSVWPGEGTEIEEWSPAREHISFQPSFSGYEIALRKTDPPRWQLNQRSTDPAEILVFPSPEVLPEPENTPEPAVEESPGRFMIATELETELGFEVDEAALSDALNTPTGRLRAYISIDEQGRIRNWAGLERSDEATRNIDPFTLGHALRFEPRPGAELQWCWIEIQW